MAHGPQNVVSGDQDFTDLPVTEVPEVDLTEELRMAKFSKTTEYQRLKEYAEARIVFYQHFLPDGKEVALQAQPTPEDWRVANRVIGEFRALLDAYENANEAVKNVSRPDRAV